MDNCNRLLICAIFIICGVSVISGSPRVDEFSRDNFIEYQYRYAVDESKSKGPVMDRWEHRIGEYVKGAYSVVDPDGRVRTVDYEVDGKKGYHAVIRLNEPGPKLLSYQQLSKSIELFPKAVLPSPTEGALSSPSKNQSPSDTAKAWNYHSNTPYVNQIGAKTDRKDAASTQVTRSTAHFENLANLPISPANYNVPQTTNVIYFKTPAASIFQRNFQTLSLESSHDVKRETALPLLFHSEQEETLPRKRRNSKLVKRFKSFADFS